MHETFTLVALASGIVGTTLVFGVGIVPARYRNATYDALAYVSLALVAVFAVGAYILANQ